jgi:hypothetical protein
MDLRAAVGDLIRSGAAQDGYTKTPELERLEKLGEQMQGEPIRGALKRKRYYIDGVPSGWLSEPHYLPPRFETPIVLGVLEGVVKLHKVQENPELMIGVSPFELSDREDITDYYRNNIHAINRWHQPLGLRNKDRDKRLWLPAIDFEFTSSHRDDDYIGAEIATSETFRAGLRHILHPEQPETE